MKNKFKRIVSSLLILAFLISAMSVFAFASEDGVEDEVAANVEVLVNRTYEEGWEFNNGFTDASKGNKYFVDYEEDSEYNYNYFFRLEAANADNSYAQLTFGTDAARSGATIVEMSLKLDDYADIGNILLGRTEVKEENISILDIVDGELIAFNGRSKVEKTIAKLDDEWLDIALIFNWDETDFTCTIEYKKRSDEGSPTVVPFTFKYKTDGDKGFKWLQFGMAAADEKKAEERIGMSYCIDNLKIYNSDIAETQTIPETNYGKKLNLSTEKVVNIQAGSGYKSNEQILKESLCMKVNVNYALVRDEREAIFTNEDGVVYGAPVIKNGEVMIPLQLLLDYIDFPYYIHPDNISFDITTGTSVTYITVGRDNAKVDDDRVELTVAPDYIANENGDAYLAIALADLETLFPGWLSVYDDMGLIVIYEDSTPENKDDNVDIVNRNTSLSTMLDLMKKFVFDIATAEKANDAYIATGTSVYNDAKKYTNDFDHPYIYANQETFDNIKNTYALNESDEKYDKVFKSYVDSIINSANETVNLYADLNNGQFSQIKTDKYPINLYSDGKNPDPSNPDDTTVADTADGYDSVGGRLELIVTYTEFLPNIAFAYQVTGNKMYVDFAYAWMSALGEWVHWGPGYFTNCADAVKAYSVAYDWLYDGFKANDYDTDKLAEIIYTLGVHDGYVSSSGRTCEHPRNMGDSSIYTTDNSNRNAVGSSGMIIASLAIFGYVDDHSSAQRFDEAIYLVGNNLTSLANYGLDEYAPDGSYIESVTYWAYATNALFNITMALESSTGKDYGFMDTWGIDKTCYYAVHITSSDGIIWNYHDSGADGVTNGNVATADTSSFAFVSKYFKDPALNALRQKHIERGSEASIYDIIYYTFDNSSEDVEVDLPLDYYMQGIESFVSRDSWDEGALYTGIMGGANNANNAQLDSGNFIYHNKGIVWFMDLGSERQDVYGYYSAQRYKYYRTSAEGQNVVIPSNSLDIPYGQLSSAVGKITNTYTNEYGSYAILDNSSAYGDTVFFAKRGILNTNDRETVVIQDEISVVKIQTYYWVAHTAAKITISEDGRTAYLTDKGSDGKEYTLRVSLVSKRPDIVFQEFNATTEYLLTATAGFDYSTNNGGVSEYSREGIKRLAICQAETSSFEVAVVLEMVDGVNSTAPVGYEWAQMSEWTPTAAKDYSELNKVRDPAKRSDINAYNTRASMILENDDAFTDYIESLYDAITMVAYAFETFDPQLNSDLINPFIKHEGHVEVYEAYMEYMSKVINNTNNLANTLVGFEVEIDE